jgi:NAD(P)-dependent dehydrogenase (short-subunit alcohol dehydrogenase family)
MRRFEGKAALITGGASGIGRATAFRLADEGAAVAVADIDAGKGADACRQIEEMGGRALYIGADVTDAPDVEAMVASTVQAWGRLDVLVTAAGIGGGGTVVDLEEAAWERMLDLDLKGVYLACKYAIPEMRKVGGGAIVHIASIGGLRGDWGGAAFSAAKGGVVNLTRHMAVAHATENIRVNCVCPGVIETPLTAGWLSNPVTRRNVTACHPIGRLGRPEEVAAAIAFLASDDASFVSGAMLVVDGGAIAASGRQVFSALT